MPYDEKGALFEADRQRVGTDGLFEMTYEELRSLARKMMSTEKPGLTLGATGLVHEAYLRLCGERMKPWANKRHFFVTASEAMRRILIDNARQKQSIRHGGGLRRTEFTESEFLTTATADAVLDVNAALDEFVKIDPLKAELVKLRFFGGVQADEAAALLGISEATGKRHWRYAKAWLREYVERISSADGNDIL